MSQAQRQQSAPQTQTKAFDAEAWLARVVNEAPAQERQPLMRGLLDRMLAGAETNARGQLLNDTLGSKEALIEEVLPPQLKGQAKRLIKRAMMTFAMNPNLRDCPPDQFVRCVVRAAEIGFAIDGKLCYVVKYKTAWEVCPDYKGLIAVAKRCGQIKHCKADIVRVNDWFDYAHVDGHDRLNHKIGLGGIQERGDVRGAYASFIMPDGHFECCYIERWELDKIRAHAPAKAGPWATWTEEMMKKSPIRRGLKMHCDDPGIIAMLELEDEMYEDEPPPKAELPTGRMDLRAKPVEAPKEESDAPLAGGNGELFSGDPNDPANDSPEVKAAVAASKGA